MRLTAPHQNYVCPEGANVTLVCEQHGHHQGEIRTWLYTPHLDRKCHGGQRPRGGRTPHTNRSLPASEVAVYLEDTQRVMLSLTAVKMGDQGRYCCLVGQKHHKGTLHSHVLLTVGPRKGVFLWLLALSLLYPSVCQQIHMYHCPVGSLEAVV